jgi:SOS-response transcriptional repressor LexA
MTKFAKSLDLDLPALRKYLLDERKPGAETQSKLAVQGCNLNWLLTGKGSMRDLEIVTLRSLEVVPLTKLGGTMRAADGSLEYASIPEDLAGQIEAPAIRITDDSMAGVVWKNDIVFVSPKSGAENSELCLVNVKGEGYALRHVYHEGENIMLLATNAPPRTIPKSNIISIQRVICANILGVHLKHK